MTSHTIADDGHVFASGYSFKQILAFAVQPAHSYTFAVKALANLEPVEGISDVTCDLDRFNAAGDDIRTLDTDDFDKYIQYGIDATLTLDAGLNTSEGGTARLLCRGTNNAISSATSS